MQAGPPPDALKPKGAAKPASKRPSTRNLEEDIGAVLVTANIMMAPFIGNDAMDDAEIVALAKAMNDQARQSPTFRRYIERMLQATGASSLVGVVLIIIGRRAARHRAIDPAWDVRLGMMLRVQNADIDPNDPDAMAAAMQAAAEAMVAAETTDDGTGPQSATGAAAPAL